jgi:hypothetical protein
MSKPNPCLDAALDYLQRGWSAIALCPPDHEGMPSAHQKNCTNPGKVPWQSWEAYQSRRARPEEIRIAWNRFPRSNVGIALGPVSGMIALDIDGPNAGELAEQLFGAQGLPPTLYFDTPGGGKRLFYSCPEDCLISRKRWDTDASHVILMGYGTETVMPPSIHAATGKTYEWPAEILPIAPLPGVVATAYHDALCPTPDPAPPPTPHVVTTEWADVQQYLRARAYLEKCDPAVSGQRGHDQTFKVACKLVKGFDLPPEVALALLLEHYNPRCIPPWSIPELQHKVNDAAKQEGPNGYMLHDPQPAARRQTLPPIEAKKKPTPRPDIIKATALMGQEFGEIHWAVDGLIPEGATILAGRPKVGKSWLVLGTAFAAAQGGIALGRIPVQAGPVLYLALEDGQRRLQRRLQKLIDAQQLQPPDNLDLAVQWPRSSDGGVDAINQWLDDHPGARLVIVDTLARMRDRRRQENGLYEEDYEAVSLLQQIGLSRNVAILVITHTRKPKSSGDEDFLDEVQNSTGLTGAADCVLVLKRPRQSREGTLFVTGRDVDERKISLSWDPQYCLWTQNDEPAEDQLSPDQQAVLDLITQNGGPMPMFQIIMGVHKDPDAGRKLVQRMAAIGLLKKTGYGVYDKNVSNLSNCPTPPNQAEQP